MIYRLNHSEDRLSIAPYWIWDILESKSGETICFGEYELDRIWDIRGPSINRAGIAITIGVGLLALVISGCSRSDKMASLQTVEEVSPLGLESSSAVIPTPIEDASRSNFTIESSSSKYSIVVNTTDDLEAIDGNCSLREAIRAANLDKPVDACASGKGTDNIFVGAGVYRVATARPLEIRTDLALVGAGPRDSIIQVQGPISSDLITSIFSSSDVDFSITGIGLYLEPDFSGSSSLN
jgi:CSLREA domain-containing protein